MAANSNTSSKFKDIILKSILIQSGSPAVYQLRPKKEDNGTLTRMTLGEKDPNKTNRTILLVGETGTGKSTLINSLVNYAMGVKWEDDVWFQIVEDEKRSQSESQTSDVIVYQIFGFEDQTLPHSLTIIDTPGYGDTRGIEQDDFISEKLFDLFTSDDGVNEINAVGLVLKASENRLSDRLKYTFDSAVSLFGKNMEKNIVALITHSNGRTPKNALKALEAANIKCARNEKNQPVHYLFDNCQHEDRTEDTEDLQHSDEITTKGMNQFRVFLEKTEPQKLNTTVDVLTERTRLTACIQNLKERIDSIELEQEEINKNKKLLKEHEDEMKKNKNFIKVDYENYKEKETIGDRATYCKKCEENCHHPCGAGGRRCCKVMSRSRCTVCTWKCHVSDHERENKKYVNKTRRVEKTLQYMKDKYLKGEADVKDTKSLLDEMEKKMENLKKDKDQWLDESFHHVVKLEQIALNADSLSTYQHLDFLIKKMKERGDEEKVQKLEEMKKRVERDESTKAGLRYKLTAAGRAVKDAIMK